MPSTDMVDTMPLTAIVDDAIAAASGPAYPPNQSANQSPNQLSGISFYPP